MLATISTPSTNLPLSLSTFVGREQELVHLRRVFGTTSVRLLTLAGAGGSGKTRLAQELARGLNGRYADGVWLVELAALSATSHVPQAIASVLDVREQPERTFADALGDYLRGKRLLLILDNCEHLLDPCAKIASHLLCTCPHLHLLATSREPLGIEGEVVWRVPPLKLPNPRHMPPLDVLQQADAVRLFAERAAAALPGFAVDPHNAHDIAEICHRLDGLPLAIELAAARVQMFSVEQIARGLDQRFRLLSSRRRTATPHHQTLRATLDWSYDLLTPAERRLFKRLAVFTGGFTLEGAEAVCNDPSARAGFGRQ